MRRSIDYEAMGINPEIKLENKDHKFSTPCSDFNCIRALIDKEYIEGHANNCPACKKIYDKMIDGE